MKYARLAAVALGLLTIVLLAGPFGCGSSDEDEYVLSTTPPVPGQMISVATGSDPDVAVDPSGYLHFAYVRDGAIWYMKYDYSLRAIVIPETLVGGGDDPQIAVDSKGDAHIAFGNVYYSSWTGAGFSPPVSILSGRGRPRIAVDSMDRAYVAGMRTSGPRCKLFVFEDNTLIVNGVEIGKNDLGGIDVDGSNRVHVCWRSGRDLFYATYLLGGAPEGIVDQSVHISGYASDFSDIAVDHRDGSLHIAHTHSFGGSIDYIYRDSAGVWSTDSSHAAGQCLDAADFTQPTIAIDRDGYKYVVVTGDHFIPKYFVIGREGTEIVGVTDIDPVLVSGAKKKNPNVASRPDMSGAYVTWGEGTVHVRPLGAISY